MTQKVLIVFRHGLGDAVQLTSVLAHLRHYHPDWELTIAVGRGKHSALREFGTVVMSDPDRSAFDQVFDLHWWECSNSYAGHPSTKAEQCLRDVFKLEPRPELTRYSVPVSREALEAAAAYFTGLGATRAGERFNVVLLHYEGNTSTAAKNLSHETAGEICAAAIAAGQVPVILDWDDRSPLPDGKQIFCPDKRHPIWQGHGTGDAEQIAALIRQAALFVGIDSGPQKIALSTETPTLAVWVGMFPAHYAVPTANAFHLCSERIGEKARGREVGEYFGANYRQGVYRDTKAISEVVAGMLKGEKPENILNRGFLRQLQSTAYNATYYEEHRVAGLDYLNYGGWQQAYGRWFVQSLQLAGKKVLDVGCACGAILRGLGEAGAVVHGIELNEHMLELGRRKWPDMRPLMHCCDACNMHLYADASWDAIHCAQVAEHWKPELVPHILRECRRVLKPGGLLWVSLDTQELFDRQGRRLESDDPTHYCIRPRQWWDDQLEATGWTLATKEAHSPLSDHPESYLRKYDWDWFAARNPVGAA